MRSTSEGIGKLLFVCGALLLAAWRIDVPSADIQPWGGGTVIMGGNSTNANYATTAGSAQTANSTTNVTAGGNVTTNIALSNVCISSQYLANGNYVFIGPSNDPNAFVVGQYIDGAFGETEYGIMAPARIGTNAAGFNSGVFALGGFDTSHVGLLGQAPNPNAPVGMTGGTLALRFGDGSATSSSPGIGTAFVYIPNNGPVHVQGGGSASNPPFQMCSTLNGNTYVGCAGMHAVGTSLGLDSNGALAALFDGSQNAALQGNVTANGNYLGLGNLSFNVGTLGGTPGLYLTGPAGAGATFKATYGAFLSNIIAGSGLNGVILDGFASVSGGNGSKTTGVIQFPTVNTGAMQFLQPTGTLTGPGFSFNGNIALAHGAFLGDGNITTPVSTVVNGEIFSSTTALFGNSSLGYEFWFNGSNTLYITNPGGGTTVNINTGGITSHGVFSVTNPGPLSFVAASGYGVGASSASNALILTANNANALILDANQNALFKNVTLDSQGGAVVPSQVNTQSYFWSDDFVGGNSLQPYYSNGSVLVGALFTLSSQVTSSTVGAFAVSSTSATQGGLVSAPALMAIVTSPTITYRWRTLFNMPSLGSATNNYTAYVGGFHTTGAANSAFFPGGGPYIKYNQGVNSGNWVLGGATAANSGSQTTTNSTVAVAPGSHNLVITLVNGTYTYVLDGTTLGTVASGLPTATNATINCGAFGVASIPDGTNYTSTQYVVMDRADFYVTGLSR